MTDSYTNHATTTGHHPSSIRHCGQLGCRCTHGASMGGGINAGDRCDRGWIDNAPPRPGENPPAYESVRPCPMCWPEKAEAVDMAAEQGVPVSRMLSASRKGQR